MSPLTNVPVVLSWRTVEWWSAPCEESWSVLWIRLLQVLEMASAYTLSPCWFLFILATYFESSALLYKQQAQALAQHLKLRSKAFQVHYGCTVGFEVNVNVRPKWGELYKILNERLLCYLLWDEIKERRAEKEGI